MSPSMRMTVGLVVLGAIVTGARGEDDRWGHPSDGVQQPRLVEELRIDGHEEILVPIGDVAVYDDGTILVAQPQDAQVRYYSDEGELLGTYGRRGQGPGEFSGISRLGLVGDTAWVYDASHRRVTFISPERSLVRTVSIPTEMTDLPASMGPAPQPLRPDPRVVRPDGWMYVTFPISGTGTLPDAPELFRRPSLGLMSPDGSVEWIVSVRHDVDVFLRIGGVLPALFPVAGQITGSYDGDLVVGMSTSLEGDFADTFELTAWDLHGELLWSRRIPFEPRPIPSSVADSALTAMLERLPPQIHQAYREEVTVPSVYPPLHRLQVGTDGRIWIEKAPRDDERPHMVVSREGDLIGRIGLPARARVVHAGPERIWVVEADALDVESLVRYLVEWE